MKKSLIITTLLLLLVLLAGCASKPEATEAPPEETPVVEPVVEPAEEPVEKVEEPVETAPPEVVADIVNEEEILLAEDAVERAESAGAANYSPDLFLAANEDLENAKSLKESDPDQSRALLASSIANAEKAYNESVDAQVEKKIAKLRSLESKLIEIEAEKFSPEEYKIVKNRADKLVVYLNEEDYENADKQYNSTLRAMQNLYDTVDNNIRWVQILERDTKSYMADAEEKEVFLWAPEEMEKSNYLYSEGISQYNNYDLKGSEKSLKEAKYWAFHSIRLSEERQRQSKTDALMLEALRNLERASQNRVMNEDGTITEADPWEGSDYIEENPAPDTTTDEFTEEGSSLKEYEPDAEVIDNNSSFLINGTTSVLGDEQKLSLLDKAIELWKQGVKARSEGKFDIADEYFKQSNAYAEAYNANAVADEYVVKKRDTLWAISGREDILDNPFLWTKLWRRNSQIIENPDLIFPGQKLIIPPK